MPNLNHFATQGASGGVVSIVNVDFVREVNSYSGAFPAACGNMLSSMLDFRPTGHLGRQFSPRISLSYALNEH